VKPSTFLVVAAAAVGRVQVDAAVIDLPDLDDRALDRLAGWRQHAAGQVRDLADSLRDAVVDDEQVVVGVQRQPVGVERAFGHARGAGQVLRKSGGRRHGQRP